MAKKNPKVDTYVLKAQPFAKPILKRLRTIIHKGCPKVTEEIKWGAYIKTVFFARRWALKRIALSFSGKDL
jgi:hypothetical protein